jgi:hypothetical protein
VKSVVKKYKSIFTTDNTEYTDESQRSQKGFIADKNRCLDVSALFRKGNPNIEHGAVQRSGMNRTQRSGG